MIKKKRAHLFFLTLPFLLCATHSLFASFEFANKSSHMVLMDESSQLNLSQTPSKAWEEFSVIRNHAAEVPATGVKIYSDTLEHYIFNIHGPGLINLAANYTLSYNMYLSSDHKLFVNDDLILYGNDHEINCALNTSNMIVIAANKNVTFDNIRLVNFSPNTFSLESGASVTFGDQTQIILGDNQTLSTTWAFTGNASIYGQGNVLTLGSGSQITIAAGDSLLFKDINISGLQNTNIRCLDDTTTLSFENAELSLTHDFLFIYGGIHVKEDVTICGTNSFAYKTTQSLIIDSESTLHLDQNVTFTYWPTGATSNQLIQLTDASSELHLTACNINAVGIGLQLTKGKLFIEDKVTFDGPNSLASAFVFGDGSSSANDLYVHFAGRIIVNTGYLEYKNVNN